MKSLNHGEFSLNVWDIGGEVNHQLSIMNRLLTMLSSCVRAKINQAILEELF